MARLRAAIGNAASLRTWPRQWPQSNVPRTQRRAAVYVARAIAPVVQQWVANALVRTGDMEGPAGTGRRPGRAVLTISGARAAR
eukprot:3176961-Lingulodinium_polyedra.AAC.1